MLKLPRKVSLAVLLVGLSSTFTAANAAPDPMFEPVLEEIRQELPQGWQFRLPAAVPSDGELYPFISEASDTKLVVSLGITPNCASPNCTIGMIGVTHVESTSQNWPPEGRNVTLVNLSEDVQGYHLLRGEGNATNQLVVWRQDGLLYAIVTLANATPQNEFVAMASSMVSEPPISR